MKGEEETRTDPDRGRGSGIPKAGAGGPRHVAVPCSHFQDNRTSLSGQHLLTARGGGENTHTHTNTHTDKDHRRRTHVHDHTRDRERRRCPVGDPIADPHHVLRARIHRKGSNWEPGAHTGGSAGMAPEKREKEGDHGHLTRGCPRGPSWPRSLARRAAEAQRGWRVRQRTGCRWPA